MELICTGCFTHPGTTHRNTGRDAVEMRVCSLGAVDLPKGDSVYDVLRCSYCGSTVHLDHHHVAWYDN